MADISKISIDGGETEYNVKDTVARSEVSAIDEKIPSAATSSNKLVDTATLTTGLAAKADASLIGEANGIATLNGTGKVPESQLPSYVDDVIEGYYYNDKFYSDSAHTTEITPETGKIYVDLTEDKTYRWSGSVYVCVGGGAIEWGGITGTLANQTDLANALAGADVIVNDTVGWVNKNLLSIHKTGTYTSNDLNMTFVSNSDGELTGIALSGTPSAAVKYRIDDGITLDAGDYYINDNKPDAIDKTKLYLTLEGYGTSPIVIDGDTLFTAPSYLSNLKLYLNVASGYNVSNRYIYPMIRKTVFSDPTFRPFNGTTVKDALGTKQDNMTYSYSNGRLTLNTIAEAE